MNVTFSLYLAQYSPHRIGADKSCTDILMGRIVSLIIGSTLFGATSLFFYRQLRVHVGTAVAQWLRCCATNQKVAGSIPAGVRGFFIDIKSFRSHCGPGVDSASNRNEYQEYFLGLKAAGALG